MTARVDILDQPERLRGAFWASVLFHAGVFGVCVALTVFKPFGGKVIRIGDPKGGGFGSVAVNAVNTIPIPNRGAAPNPVANDTESKVPQAPAKAKPQPKVAKAPDPNAIALKGKNAKERKQAAAPNKWADQQPQRPNQTYSTSGAAASSPLYNVPGGGGIGIGTNSPFGEQFGWYANLLRDKIARVWQSSGLNAAANQVTVQFTMRRDGSLAPGLPRVVQTSGDANVDRSAQRAILDAAPFPELPPGLGRSEVTVELSFHVRR
jgi:periplasmic protein TonB